MWKNINGTVRETRRKRNRIIFRFENAGNDHF
jgi:hypothetical protein